MQPDSAAPFPTPDGRLESGRVGVHILDIPGLRGKLDEFQRQLTPDERRQAERFFFQRDRDRFIIVRAQLRRILGGLLAVDPKSLAFSRGAQGKPFLAAHSLRFNVSHQRDLGLIATAWDREIGIDVEAIEAWEAAGKIAERFFSPREQASLRALPEAARLRAFYTCWTRKEALLKAWGCGLAFPLHSFTVSLAPGEPARLIEVDGDADAPARWRLMDLALPAPYVGTLAAPTMDRD